MIKCLRPVLCILILGVLAVLVTPIRGQNTPIITSDNAHALMDNNIPSGGYIADIDLAGDVLAIGAPNGLRIYSINEVRTVVTYMPVTSEENTGTYHVALQSQGQLLAYTTIGLPDYDRVNSVPPGDLYRNDERHYSIQNPVGLITDISIALDETVYMGSSSGHLYRIKNDTVLEIVMVHPGGVTAISLSSRDQIATAGRDGIVQLGMGVNATPIADFEQPILELAWSSDETLAILLNDFSIVLWRNNMLTPLPVFGTALAWSPDGTQLAIGQQDGAIQIWELSNPGNPTQIDNLTKHSMQVNNIVWKSSALVSTAYDGIVFVWDVSANYTAIPVRPLMCCITNLSISSQDVVFSRSDSSIWAWNIETEKLRLLNKDFGGKLVKATVSPSGEYIAASVDISLQHVLQLYRWDTLSSEYTLVETNSDAVIGEDRFLFTTMPSLIVINSMGEVVEFNLPDLSERRRAKVSESGLISATLSPDESLLAVGAYDGQVFTTNFQGLNFNFQLFAEETRSIDSLTYWQNGLAAGYKGATRLWVGQQTYQSCVDYSDESGRTFLTFLQATNLLVCANSALILQDITTNMEVGRYNINQAFPVRDVVITHDNSQIFVATTTYVKRYTVGSTIPPQPTMTPTLSRALLTGVIWNDINQDGIRQQSEPLMINAYVDLFDSEGGYEGIAGTNQNGQYSFSVQPGIYIIEVDMPDYNLSPANQGGDDLIDSDFDPVTYRSEPVTLAAGEAITLDAGLSVPLPTPTSTLTPTPTPTVTQTGTPSG